MRTQLALREFIDSRTSANLRTATTEWYKGRLLPFAESCPDLPRRPEPIEKFLATVQGSPETRWNVYRTLKTFFKFISKRRRIPNSMDAKSITMKTGRPATQGMCPVCGTKMFRIQSKQ